MSSLLLGLTPREMLASEAFREMRSEAETEYHETVLDRKGTPGLERQKIHREMREVRARLEELERLIRMS